MPFTPFTRTHPDQIGKLPLEIGLVRNAHHLRDHRQRQVRMRQQQLLGLADAQFLPPPEHGLPHVHVDIGAQLVGRDADVGSHFIQRRKVFEIGFVLHPGLYRGPDPGFNVFLDGRHAPAPDTAFEKFHYLCGLIH